MMTVLSMKICLCTVFVLCMIDLSDCGKAKKLANRIDVLEEAQTELEKQVTANEDELRSEVEQTLDEFNSSFSEKFRENVQQMKQYLETEISLIKSRTENVEGELLKLGTKLTTEVKNFDRKLRSPIVKCWINGHIYGNSCYMLLPSRNWHFARRRCELMGAHLVEVQSEEENKFLEFFLHSNGNSYSFIGGYDFLDEGVWRWISNNQTLTYTNWKDGEPNGMRRENCIIMNKNPGWLDYNCMEELDYVCEFTPYF